jgi:hypothetical protein
LTLGEVGAALVDREIQVAERVGILALVGRSRSRGRVDRRKEVDATERVVELNVIVLPEEV